MKTRNLTNRIISAILCFVFFLTNSLFVHAAESNFWAERRKSISQNEEKPTQLASLPVGMANGLANPKDLLRQFPSLNKTLETVNTAPNHPTAAKLPPSIAPYVNAIPLNYGTLKELYANSKNGDHSPLVILLQDVHMNDEAQKNLANILLSLNDKSSLLSPGHPLLVGVEGAFGAFDFTRFRSFEDKGIIKSIAGYFLQEKKIAAPSYAGITADELATKFVGIDDPTHYQTNVKAYLDSQSLKKINQTKLEKASRVLADLKRRTLNSELLKFDARQAKHLEENNGFGDYVSYLSKTAEGLSKGDDSIGSELVLEQFLAAYEMESNLDFAKVERERAQVVEKLAAKLTKDELNQLVGQSLAYRMGQISFAGYYKAIKSLIDRHGIPLSATPAFDKYIRYVLLADGIKAEELMSAVQRLENQVLNRLCRTETERGLIRQSRQLFLISKLMDFGLTPDEWDEYRKIVSDSEAKNRLPGSSEKISLESFEQFYEEADTRSYTMIQRLFSQLESNGSQAIEKKNQGKIAVIVVGGFHTPRLTRLLKEKGSSYAVIQPKITKIDGLSGTEYLSVFNREKTPLDQLFEGEKLFLAPDMLAAGTNMPKVATINEQIPLVTGVYESMAGKAVQPEAKVDVKPSNDRSYEAKSKSTGRSYRAYQANSNSSRGKRTRIEPPDLPPTDWEPVSPSFSDLLARFNPNKASKDQSDKSKRSPTFKIAAFNSTFILAPILTAVTVGIIAAFGLAISWPLVLGIYLAYKAILFLSVVIHESAHLWSDGQFQGKTIGQKISLALGSLNQRNIIAAFVVGTDITNAFVTSSDREGQLSVLKTLLQDKDFALEMAGWLDGAYYRGQGQTPPPFISPEEETRGVSKSVKEEKIAMNLAGFYALECAIGAISERTGQTPSAILQSIANGTLSREDMLLIARFANATWKAGQPFRSLGRIARDTFRPAALLTPEELEKDFVQIRSAAEKLLQKMTSMGGVGARDTELQTLKTLLQSKEFALEMAAWLDGAYYRGQGQEAPPFISPEEETAQVQKNAKEEKIAMNVAGFYALESGIGVLSERTGRSPLEILRSIIDGTISNEDMLLIARFANATWKAGQPFRSLDRITRDTFRPAALLTEEELAKDFVQIRAAAEKLWDKLTGTSDVQRLMTQTSRTAIMGPAANFGLILVGAVLALIAFGLAQIGLNEVATGGYVASLTITIANATLLITNALLGTDFKIWKQGFTIGGKYRSGLGNRRGESLEPTVERLAAIISRLSSKYSAEDIRAMFYAVIVNNGLSYANLGDLLNDFCDRVGIPRQTLAGVQFDRAMPITEDLRWAAHNLRNRPSRPATVSQPSTNQPTSQPTAAARTLQTLDYFIEEAARGRDPEAALRLRWFFYSQIVGLKDGSNLFEALFKAAAVWGIGNGQVPAEWNTPEYRQVKMSQEIRSLMAPRYVQLREQFDRQAEERNRAGDAHRADLQRRLTVIVNRIFELSRRTTGAGWHQSRLIFTYPEIINILPDILGSSFDRNLSDVLQEQEARLGL